jgi:hypothetical protein
MGLPLKNMLGLLSNVRIAYITCYVPTETAGVEQ